MRSGLAFGAVCLLLATAGCGPARQHARPAYPVEVQTSGFSSPFGYYPTQWRNFSTVGDVPPTITIVAPTEPIAPPIVPEPKPTPREQLPDPKKSEPLEPDSAQAL